MSFKKLFDSILYTTFTYFLFIFITFIVFIFSILYCHSTFLSINYNQDLIFTFFSRIYYSLFSSTSFHTSDIFVVSKWLNNVAELTPLILLKTVLVNLFSSYFFSRFTFLYFSIIISSVYECSFLSNLNIFVNSDHFQSFSIVWIEGIPFIFVISILYFNSPVFTFVSNIFNNFFLSYSIYSYGFPIPASSKALLQLPKHLTTTLLEQTFLSLPNPLRVISPFL